MDFDFESCGETVSRERERETPMLPSSIGIPLCLHACALFVPVRAHTRAFHACAHVHTETRARKEEIQPTYFVEESTELANSEPNTSERLMSLEIVRKTAR